MNKNYPYLNKLVQERPEEEKPGKRSVPAQALPAQSSVKRQRILIIKKYTINDSILRKKNDQFTYVNLRESQDDQQIFSIIYQDIMQKRKQYLQRNLTNP